MFSIVKIRFTDCDPIGHLNNVKYLKYMQDAREDHIEEFFGFSYDEYIKRTGCAWITIKNQIAYLKEVKANTKVRITSHTVNIDEKTTVVEILMTSEDRKTTHAVLWITAIYFNLKTRKTEEQPEDLKHLFHNSFLDLGNMSFDERAEALRKENKAH